MNHYTNLHTFTLNTKKFYWKKHHFGTILCFCRFSEHSTKCKLRLNYAKLFKMFLTLSTILQWNTRAYQWIVEIRRWTFYTNFIPKYHCAWCHYQLLDIVFIKKCLSVAFMRSPDISMPCLGSYWLFLSLSF